MIWLVLAVLAIALAWFVIEKQKRRTHPMPGGIDSSRPLPHTAEWELYHNSLSLCSKKTRVCLAELGIDYVGHHVDLIETGAYENLSRDFLAVNPAALVPVLVHNGLPIYESHEQLAYAAAHAEGGHSLVPRDETLRSTMETWVAMGALTGDDPVAAATQSAGNAVPGLTAPLFAVMIRHIPYRNIFEGLLFHRLRQRPLLFLAMKLLGPVRTFGLTPFRKVIGLSRKAMFKHLDQLEAQLRRGGPWICGEEFTLADVGFMVLFDRLREADWEDTFFTEDRPMLCQYWQALKDRPSYQAAVAAFAHPTVTRGTAEIIALKEKDPAIAAVLS